MSAQQPLPTGKSQTMTDRFGHIWNRLTSPIPVLKTVTEQRKAQTLSILTLILGVLSLAAIFSRPSSYDAFVILASVSFISYALSRTKNYRVGVYLFTYAFTLLTFIRIYRGDAESIEAAVATTVHIALAFSSALLSRRGFVWLVAVSTAATFAAPYYSAIPGDPGNIARAGGVVLVIGAVLYGVTVFRENLEREQRQELTDSNRELQDVKAHLEESIEARTMELNQTIEREGARIDRLNTIINTIHEISLETSKSVDDLLERVAKLISDNLGYYHVGVFLLDERREFAVLKAANSEGGQRMLAREHQLKVGGAGIVGYVSQSGRPRIALDTGADAVFFNNPDLPQTRSEISLPIRADNKVIGVLDVQSTEASAFTQEDTRIFSMLANLLGSIVQNRQMMERGGRDSMTASGLRGGQFFRPVAGNIGYSYRPDGITASNYDPKEDPLARKAIATGEVTASNRSDAGIPPTVAVPVKLRDQVIGIIRVEASEFNRKWTEDEVSVVQAISERAAFALENARLLEDATRRAEQEETIARVTTRIGASTDIERILKTTIQEIGQALGTSRSFIQIGTVGAKEGTDE